MPDQPTVESHALAFLIDVQELAQEGNLTSDRVAALLTKYRAMRVPACGENGDVAFDFPDGSMARWDRKEGGFFVS